MVELGDLLLYVPNLFDPNHSNYYYTFKPFSVSEVSPDDRAGPKPATTLLAHGKKV